MEGTIIRWVGFYLLAESISFATLARKKSFEPKIEMKPILSKLVRRILGGNSMNFPLSLSLSFSLFPFPRYRAPLLVRNFRSVSFATLDSLETRDERIRASLGVGRVWREIQRAVGIEPAQ